MTSRGFQSIKASIWRGKIQIVSSVMADDLLYHFSDEDDDEDALFDRAFDRWQQLGGAAARGPLFQFTMQPMGRRRRWRDVVERAQFNAQLRQLRDPVPGDNIGMALTEALHQAIETELPIILSILPSRRIGSPMLTKQPILRWGSFYNARHVWMRC